ncbi:hypothetical protein ASPZODRAFT_127260 [Penicilliopsis zonata CBS 506.65]|uniref:UBC core domain-containing protein n=1 Tax=Penicilliopsis zonata CBS 506.65 TaxID=1073090 RepID=A0A1L9SVI4_9EURO|nr:hypothetical protein ASPZODRAFT_127260 [Penicilliopsis zonata CBS 506.65]OJJ51230.1 hypothetical protein ASPZODRAFT_127260 [Penicilliopsis zonata CBS 506.65]
MPSSTRRLMKEAAELSNSPSPHFHAHPVSDSNLFDWHFTLAGPPSPSPYAQGIYHGRIVLPAAYPLRPPSFRFLTPSGRFEVNREICLSISGHHEETWQPAWGIRTALLAIRTFMDGDAKGQVGGLDVSEEVRRAWAEQSRAWCCESCGRSNAEILREQAEVCQAKGISGDGDEKDEENVKELAGLKVAYRDELGVGKSQQPSQQQTGSEETQIESTESSLGTNSVQHQVQQPLQQPVQQPVHPPLQQPVQQQVQSQPQTQTTQRQTPWLDRAIVGVVIALVLMILRRVSNLEDI